MFALPESVFLSKSGVIIWAVLQILIGLSFAVFATVGWAMVADCIDYQEMQTGKREEGTVYAIYSLGRKIAQGLGAAVVLLFLGWLGFQEAEKIDLGQFNPEYAGKFIEGVSVQTPIVANRIRMLIGGIYAVCSLAQFLMIKFVYPLTKDKVEEMNKKLGRTNEVDLVQAMQED